jgi:hypothetical protein
MYSHRSPVASCVAGGVVATAETLCFAPFVNSVGVCVESTRADGWDGQVAAVRQGPQRPKCVVD